MTITDETTDADAGGATEGDRTLARTCPLCEAGCGLSVTIRGSEVTRVRGDLLDVFSHGYLCPKGSTLRQLHDDPDRLREPLVRRGDRLEPATWEEAWQAVADGLGAVIDEHGRSSLGAYVGNPNAHNLGALLYNRVLLKSLG
ncbi:MAG: molybdopterin-dependent oxidoreductase, partial [Acidimicrobiales bacterium]|nr:molybdopterin-dependent oxidoreductase [Acidimicrobiales bacterium]